MENLKTKNKKIKKRSVFLIFIIVLNAIVLTSCNKKVPEWEQRDNGHIRFAKAQDYTNPIKNKMNGNFFQKD